MMDMLHELAKEEVIRYDVRVVMIDGRGEEEMEADLSGIYIRMLLRISG